MLEKSSKPNPFLLLYGLKPSAMQLGSKTALSLTPLNPILLHTKFILVKKPSLKSLCLFGCKAYAHTLKINQSKFGEHTTECVHVGFAEEKKGLLTIQP